MKRTPPRCPKIPKTIVEHGVSREDPYFWLKEKENPEVRKYIEEENRYYQETLASLKDLKEHYFETLKGLMEKEIYEVPAPKGPWLYGSRIPEGLQYPIFFRQKDSRAPEQVLLDLNETAKTHDYVSLGAFQVSDDHSRVAYSIDTDGSEEHRVHFHALGGEAAPSETIEKTEGDLIFSKDGKVLYYTRLNDQHRPYQVWRHRLHSPTEQDELLYEEADPRFFASLSQSSDEEHLLLRLQSMESIEYRFAPRTSDFRELEVFSPRAPKHEYELDTQEDRFLILSNREERNFFFYEAPLTSKTDWKVVFRGDARNDLREMCVLKDHVAILYGNAGIPSLRIFSRGPIGQPAASHEPAFPEVIRDLNFSGNSEFHRRILRLKYSSPITPQQTLEIDLDTHQTTLLHQRKIENYDPSQFMVERIEVASSDGVKVPVSLLYRKKDAGRPLPTLLYGYGSYGSTSPTGFSIIRVATASAGFLYAVGHIRGGGDLGRRWYEDGKFLKKQNTFLDFQACAQGLIAQGRSRKGDITLHGGSAGGLLVTATMNLDPSLYRGIIAEVPFVDVLSTMFDETLPLTPIEWDEWGNPQNREYFEAMRAYSPYDNLQHGEYPYVLVNGGWNDPRVTYWEPSKFVARLRDLRTDSRLTLLDIEMGAGHFGVTGRYAALEKPSELLAFLHAIHLEPARLE